MISPVLDFCLLATISHPSTLFFNCTSHSLHSGSWKILSLATPAIVLGTEQEEFLSGVWGSILFPSALCKLSQDFKASTEIHCRVGRFLSHPPSSSWAPLSLGSETWARNFSMWHLHWELLVWCAIIFLVLDFLRDSAAGAPQVAHDWNRECLARVWCEIGN